jgi:beta-galactosidase
MTHKWQLVRDTIKKYVPNFPTYDVQNNTKKSYGAVKFTEGLSFWDSVDQLVYNSTVSENPIRMELLNAGNGYVLYRATSPVKAGRLTIAKVHDRGYVFVDKKFVGLVTGGKANLTGPAGMLDILVENQGRANAGYFWGHVKGILSAVDIDGTSVSGWQNVGLTFDKVTNLKWGTTLPERPGFYRATFNVDTIADTFLNPTGWVKGVAFVNGFNLGRYWTIGPQLTLYVPAALLKQGVNELIVFETEKTGTLGPMTFDDTPQLDIIK